MANWYSCLMNSRKYYFLIWRIRFSHMYIISLLIILFNPSNFLLDIFLNSENVISKWLTMIINLKLFLYSYTNLWFVFWFSYSVIRFFWLAFLYLFFIILYMCITLIHFFLIRQSTDYFCILIKEFSLFILIVITEVAKPFKIICSFFTFYFLPFSFTMAFFFF